MADSDKTATPPREWFEDHFRREDGTVRYCSKCGTVPFIPMGRVHGCYGLSSIEADMRGLGGEWKDAPWDWDHLHPAPNYDRPGDWAMTYE